MLALLRDLVAEGGRCLPLAELKMRLAGRNITGQAVEAVFNSYAGWAVPLAAAGAEAVLEAKRGRQRRSWGRRG